MKTYMKTYLSCIALAGSAAAPVWALESSTVGSQTNQANVTVLNSKIDSLIAAMQALVNGMTACSSERKFYSPTDPKRDGNNCVGTQDYQLTMSNTNGIATTNGQLNITNTNTANSWGGVINNAQSNGYGLLSEGTAGYGVEGTSTGSWGVVGNGAGGVYGYSTSNYGVYGISTSSWGGAFNGAYGVYVSNNSGYYTELSNGGYGLLTNGVIYTTANVQTPTLCLNGDCRSAWSPYNWGGDYGTQTGNGWNYPGECDRVNPNTGGCSCPPGYSEVAGETGADLHWTMYHHTCYK
jgi:hypothetical protein